MKIEQEAEAKRLAELELKEATENKEMNPYLLIQKQDQIKKEKEELSAKRKREEQELKDRQTKAELENSDDDNFDQATSIEQALIDVIDHRIIIDIIDFAKKNSIDLDQDKVENESKEDEWDLTLDLSEFY